ncbi:MAG: hypothetical protein ACK5ZD_05965, partial [Hyphomonadaceae bacterium]
MTQFDITKIGLKRRCLLMPIMAVGCFAITGMSTLALAQTAPAVSGLRGTVAGPDVLNSTDEANYRKAFAAASANQKAVLDEVLSSISDGTLKPHVERARLISSATTPDLPAMAAWLDRWGDVAGAGAVYE